VPRSPDEGAVTDGGSVGRIFAEVPYLRSLAAIVALCALLEALLDYTLSAAAVARFGRGEALVGFFAAFQTSTGVLSLLVQAALVRWSLARLGLAWTLAVHPIGVALLAAATAVVPRLGPIARPRGRRRCCGTPSSDPPTTSSTRRTTGKRPTKPLDVGSIGWGRRDGLIGGRSRRWDRARPVLVALAMASALAVVPSLRFHRAHHRAGREPARGLIASAEEVRTRPRAGRWTTIDRKDHAAPYLRCLAAPFPPRPRRVPPVIHEPALGRSGADPRPCWPTRP
jgi:hypothetical protein